MGLQSAEQFIDSSLPTYCSPTTGDSLRQEASHLLSDRGEKFPIINQIPRFVEERSYADTFGFQWKTYRTVQLDSYTGVPVTENRLRRCLGEDLWNNLNGKMILEAGCGAGRFTEVLLKKGALVQSIDLSSAVEANQINFPQNSKHRIAQADIRNLPFSPGQFDIVLCLGVIQHTPSPEYAIQALAAQVRRGGHLVLDHYTYTLSYYTKTAPLFRQVLRHLPAEKSLRATAWLVRHLLPLHRATRNFRLGQMILSRISPVLCYYQIFPELSNEDQYRFALLDTCDSLTDYYKHFRTKGQIHRTLKNLKMQVDYCARDGNGIEARAMRVQV